MLGCSYYSYNYTRFKTVRVGVHRKTVILLWALLITSVAFGIYKNFTAIDQHTIHEKEVIEQRLIDTNKIESFISDFAHVYYSWNQTGEGLEERSENLKLYLTDELQTLNQDMLGEHLATSSSLKRLQFWDVERVGDNTYTVLYSVTQTIQTTQDKEKEEVTAVYSLSVHVDDQENMVIIKNPTVSNIPGKSDYEQKAVENDGTVDAAMTEEVTEFLETFFSLYPTATEKELAYYVKDDALQLISGEYVFAELLNPVYSFKDDVVSVDVSVKFIDQKTKVTQISQFELKLKKSDNWLIIDNKK